MSDLSLTSKVSQHGLDQISETDIADMSEIEQLMYRRPISDRELRAMLVSISTVAFLVRSEHGIAGYAIVALWANQTEILAFGVHPSACTDAVDMQLWAAIDKLTHDADLVCPRLIEGDL